MKMTRLTVICISFIVVSLMFVGICDAKIDPKSIAGVWLFDEGKGDVAKDSSENDNDGTLMNNPKWGEGKFKKALEFDGTAAHVEVAHSPSLEINDAITIVVWAKGSPQPSYPRIMGKRTAVGLEIQVHPNEATVAIRIDTTATTNWLQRLQILDGNWHHIAYVLDEGNAKGYKDGVKEMEGNYPHGKGFASQDKLLIGAALPGNLFFKGILDEFAIFNQALDVDDIADIMNEGLAEAIGIGTAVSPSGQLTTTWAEIKQ
jgi:hypothetical protein